MGDEAVTMLLKLCKMLRILTLGLILDETLTGTPWMSQLPMLAPQLQLLQLFHQNGIPMDLAETAARDLPGLIVEYLANGIHEIWRTVRADGDGELKTEFFPPDGTESSRLLRRDPSLKAIREGQVVPRNVAEYFTRKDVPDAQIQVDCCDLSSYFLPRDT